FANIKNEGGGQTPIATFDIKVDHGFVVAQNSSAGTMTNTGALMKSAGTGTTTIGLPFSTACTNGTFDIKTGTVNFTNTASQTAGATTIFNGAILATTTEFAV